MKRINHQSASKFGRLLSLGLALAYITPAATATAQDHTPRFDINFTRGQRVAKLEQDQAELIEQTLHRFSKNHGEGSSRVLMASAMVLLRKDRSPLAEDLIRAVLGEQVMNPSANAYGTIPWELGDPHIQDANAIEFALQPLGPILIGHGNHLSEPLKRDVREHIVAGLQGLANHKVAVSYTNIFLMNTINTILLGQYIHDETAISRGTQQWRQWLAYTREYGIHEFDSPTYYATDLADLTMGYLYVQDPALHTQIGKALDLFWTDICANHLAAGTTPLAGAHSRDYDFLAGNGPLDGYLYMEGVGGPPQSDLTDLPMFVLENESTGGYHPGHQITDLLLTKERVVQQRWDALPGRTRTTYLAPGFAIGTANGDFNAQDKMFAVDLAGVRPAVSITIVSDTSNSPYGLGKTPDHSGHLKPTHLPPHLSSIQDKGLALLVFDLDLRKAADASSIATNLIFPSHPNGLWLDGKPVMLSRSHPVPLQLNAVFALRSQNVCFASRIFQVEPLNGSIPQMELKEDADGASKGASRLAIYHSKTGLPTITQKHLHVGFLVETFPCSTANDVPQHIESLQKADITIDSNNNAWTAKLSNGPRLELQEDPDTRTPAKTSIDGASIAFTALSINGQDFASRLTQ